MSLLLVYVSAWLALFAWASFIDFKSFILPDWLTLPLILSGVVFNAFSQSNFCSVTDSLIGVLIGYGLIRLVDECYFKLKKQRGIGQGDAKLLAAIGAILGWQAIFPILCCAAILGVVVGLCLIRVQRVTLQHQIPFGPFLSLFACAFILEKVLLPAP
jgi:leader peptidase (prepilin peptidase)/N-methyltransferase